MCHNLGGLDIISASQLITREHLGDWYRFGASQASMKNTQDNDTRNNGTWDNDNYYGLAGNWPDYVNTNIGNPCPAGWRLPAIDELYAAVNKDINPLSNVPATWLSAGSQTFSNIKKSGDYLYLTTNGERGQNDGSLSGRGVAGSYWSYQGDNYYVQGSYMNFTVAGSNTNKARHLYGMSVRCVEKE
jgi:uncharacterized protein (TIGR02145 family)